MTRARCLPKATEQEGDQKNDENSTEPESWACIWIVGTPLGVAPVPTSKASAQDQNNQKYKHVFYSIKSQDDKNKGADR
jgi:hypothetical protein